MMKTIVTVIIGSLVAGSALASGTQYSPQVARPFEVTLGAAWFRGDLDTMGMNVGFVGGLDYHTGFFGDNTTGFAGVRGWFGRGGGEEVTTYGVHYGFRFGFGEQMGGQGSMYGKVAAGYYNTDISSVGSRWGFGWFGGIGFEFQQGFAIEAGWQQGPSSGGVNNQSFYGTVGFRFGTGN